MIGLGASPGGTIRSAGAAPARLQLAGASKCPLANDADCGVHDSETEDECESLLSWTGREEPVVDGDVGGEGQGDGRADRDVVAFFRQFSTLLGGTPPPSQPVAVLQTRYQDLQHKIDKQARTKSLKAWFRDHSSGPVDAPSKSADIVVPDEIADEWGLGPRQRVHGSGAFPLTGSEWETLKRATGGGDLLLDVCGEYESSETDAVRFRTKKAAQKSAVLNLLLVMDLGDLPGRPAADDGRADFVAGASSTSTNGEAASSAPGERFRLHCVECRGATRYPDGALLSVRNPCTVACFVSVEDTQCRDRDPARRFVECRCVRPLRAEDAVRDAAEGLASALAGRGATEEEIESIMLEMGRSAPKDVAYEVAAPGWATAGIGATGATLCLYELEFSLRRGNGAHVALSEGMDLAGDEPTRVGILCGCDLRGGSDPWDLYADFGLAPSVDAVGGSCRVRMRSRTEVTSSEMRTQMEAACGKTTFEEGEGPLVLARCFNVILFNHCKTYGRGPRLDWRDLAKRAEPEHREADGRTYLFIPLRRIPGDGNDAGSEIDWRVVRDVVRHKAAPVHRARSAAFCISSISFLIAGLVCALAASLLVAKCCIYWGYWNVGSGLLVALLPPLLLCAMGASTAIGATKANYVPVRNRFLVQPVGLKGRIFVAKNDDGSEEPATALSPLLPRDVIGRTTDQVEIRLRKLNADPSKITYFEYYSHMWKNDLKGRAKAWLGDPTKMTLVKRVAGKCCAVLLDAGTAIAGLFGVGSHIRYPREPLIPAQSLIGVQYAQEELALFHEILGTDPPPPPLFDPSQHNSISNLLAARGLLVPELTFALPMPRDLLYLCQHAHIFMRRLEREHTLERIGMRLRELQRNAERSLRIENTFPASAETTMTLVDKSTSKSSTTSAEAPTHRKEEQLESLGDAVLLFFIVLNLFAKYPSCEIQYVLDLFEEKNMRAYLSNRVANESLFRAAMRMGVHRLLHLENLSPAKAWRSIYKIGTKDSVDAKPFEIISKGSMSDAVESLVGASYLIDPSGCLTIGLLNEMGPLSSGDDSDASDCSSEWFSGKGTCLKEGYPFDSHDEWAFELTKIRDVLHERQSILSKLQENSNAFCKLLEKFNASRQDEILKLQNDPVASLLIQCSLFDESFDEHGLHPDTGSLEIFANLRNKIFHIGNAALQLSILSELCRIHPTSTSGDMHLMKVILFSNDTIAYIFVKNGLHECMFDSYSDAPIELQGFMEESDSLGASEWEKRGGWILPGGSDEFKRRIQKCCGDNFSSDMREPRYRGLAAGKFWGQDKKLPDEATNELHFSMKCTVGALALALGASNAWALLRTFFLELMLLSPDEYRRAYEGISPVVSNYKKGRK